MKIEMKMELLGGGGYLKHKNSWSYLDETFHTYEITFNNMRVPSRTIMTDSYTPGFALLVLVT
jgi:hypothetical protein